MRVLALETSTDPSSVALLESGRLLAEHTFPSRMTLCETLATHIQAVLAVAVPRGSALQGATAVAVSLGPGSFTGLRMGVAMAKAIAHAANHPLIGISTPELLAQPLATAPGLHIAVLQHARKTDVYITTFVCPTAGQVAQLTPPQVASITDLPERLASLPSPVLLVGDGAEAHRDALTAALGDHITFAPPEFALPRAAVLAALAESRVTHADPQAHMTLRPIYVLASQAERTHGINLGLS